VRNKLVGGQILVDEVNQKENTLESQSGETDGIETEEVRVGADSAEALLAQKDEELARASARIAELDETVLGRDGEIASLKQSLTETEEKLAATNDSLAGAVASYKSMVIQTNPDVVEELISGDTIESVNESLEKARSLIGRVKQGLETEIASGRVPAGAPERRSPDLSALSPREKIQYGIGGKK
jgi:chromosome segregation ATPase